MDMIGKKVYIVSILLIVLVFPVLAVQIPTNDSVDPGSPIVLSNGGDIVASVTGTTMPGNSPPVTISSNKDAVVRGNNFTVTITGEPATGYWLFIKEDSSVGTNEYPEVVPGQPGVDYNGDPVTRNVTVTTTAGGTRSVQFNTNQSTKAAAYTICIEDPHDQSDRHGEVQVHVEEGTVTITVSGTGTYYIGEEITLSGTCTDNLTKVHLFMTGPNLASNGVRLDSLVPVENNETDSFNTADVKSDDTWSFRWNTGEIANFRSIDAGGYTVYAVSKPLNKEKLSDAKYAVQSIQLRSPTLTASSSGTALVKGDDYRITGIATGSPPGVNIWIFGKNYYKLGVLVPVENDGSFEYVLPSAETNAFSKGRYYVVVQHPMMNGRFDIFEDAPGLIAGSAGSGFPVVKISALQASNAATALINALDSPNIDDAYIKLSFSVDTSWIWIAGLSDQTYGEMFRVTGTTDYPAGTVLAYQITANEDGAEVLAGEVTVTDNGDWGFEADTMVIGPGAYALRVSARDGETSAVTLFDVYDDITHPVPPGGGSYRVERISITPSLDSLSPGDRVRLDSTIGCCYGRNRYLEFSTDLQDPVWSYTIEVGTQQNSVGPMTKSLRSFALSYWDLEYWHGDIHISLSLSGTAPDGKIANPTLFGIFERDDGGRIIPHSEHLLLLPSTGTSPIPSSPDNLTLHTGWNFVSIPRPLSSGNDTGAIFAGVDTNSRSVFRYDTANKNWVSLSPMDHLAPLEGLWVYSTGPTTIPLNFSTDPLLPPAERALSTGWNAIGITDTATARDALYSVNAEWATLIGYDAATQRFETGIVNGGSGANTDTRSVYPDRGYWLSMSRPGTLYAIGAGC